jgi:predicted nucleotidyltransferase
VEKLYIFGSILSDRYNEQSDIDFVVRFRNIELLRYADNYFDFKFSLEELLNRPVDLLEEPSIKNPYFIESFNETKKLIYG